MMARHKITEMETTILNNIIQKISAAFSLNVHRASKQKKHFWETVLLFAESFH